MSDDFTEESPQVEIIPPPKAVLNIRDYYWKPGQSGNPGGRPKAEKHVRDMAKKMTDRILIELYNIAIDPRPKADMRAKVAAAKEILDRGWGRPSIHVDVDASAANDLAARMAAATKRIKAKG
jgi:hypothetical protein